MGRRFPLHPQGTFTEEGYRRRVAAFETGWVDRGPLSLGSMVGPADWAKYGSPSDDDVGSKDNQPQDAFGNILSE